ncbi:MAG: molybdopterin molybdotransferase MoeA [Saprospiraceae bacterium]
MISFENAKKIVFDSVHIRTAEKVDFMDGMGRILAENIFSDQNIPPFDKSAMDGYACKKADLDNILEVVENISAGDKPRMKINKNQCSKIMTGSVIPEGADIVVMVENTEKVDQNHIKCFGNNSKYNICVLGEDCKTGDIVLKSGTLLEPRHIGVLATVGATSPLVYKKPSIGVFVTGSELVEPNMIPEYSHIRNSNAYTILAMLKDNFFEASYFGIVPDKKEMLKEKIIENIENNDVLIMSGAVSMGDYDFIPDILKEIGADILFHGMYVKPGKRMLFATYSDKYIFGLPGNPVSTYIQMQELVIPFLLKSCGLKSKENYLFVNSRKMK